MPEDKMVGTNVKSILDSMEHLNLANPLTRALDYKKIESVLEEGANLSLEEIERLLAVCVRDMRDDMKYTANIIKIISAVLKQIQVGKHDPCPDLIPSALGIIHIIKTSALLRKMESLKFICYDTLLSYPNEVLIAVADNHEEILEIFNLYCHMRIPTQIRLHACSLLHKLLKILPPEKKRSFVEKGIKVWFSKIIPSLMGHLSVVDTDLETVIEIMELLTDELVEIDYSDYDSWYNILQNICNVQKYPAIMKSLLPKGVWHRVWIVFIRLLKNQVTQALESIGTPINSMLPVVEAAFKVDPGNRCRAFECWNVLIDSFSIETNESNVNKRIKLLIIPLKSNNAKNEQTALAKFKCWWHLIQKFQNKIDKFADIVLVSFLNFCFGRYNATDKSAVVPGQISIVVKRQCIQGIVDIVGHINCDGCTDLPKLKGRLINTKHLIDNWNHWIFSLTSTIMMSANTNAGLTHQQMTCLWKSFLMTIGELPENNIRKDLFSEMLSILEHLVKECQSNSNMADVVLNALIISLFDNETRIKELLKTRNDTNDPLFRILKVLVDPSLQLAYQGHNFRDMVNKLAPVMELVLDPQYSSPTFVITYLVRELPVSDLALIVWTALMESICESKCEICPMLLSTLVTWPLKSIKSITDIKTAAMAWCTIYNLFYPKLKKTDNFDKTISKFLFNTKEVNNSIVYLKLCVTICVIKHKLTPENCAAIEKEIELLNNLISRMDTYQNYEPVFPLLIDRILSVISIVIVHVNESITRYVLYCVKQILKLMCAQDFNQLSDGELMSDLAESLLKALDTIFQVDLYHTLIPIVVDDFIDCFPLLGNRPGTKHTAITIMKTFMAKMAEGDITQKIKAVIDDIENNRVAETNKCLTVKEFTTPKSKEVPKRTKKKEASIVNTVIENGEEYVVVKSNWKFNPRKLTENQKEKLKRKREDIPALYQDLSQSQDEFKLVSWKTDSQDTSSSSKSESKSCKSGNDGTATEMLCNLPSSVVVPKILENFFSENRKESPANAKDVPRDNNVNKVEPVTPKNTKSPRMALKDRVFRNVRNLIENSGVQKENKDESEDLNKTESILKTPTQSSTDPAIIVNSAPPTLIADRPTRVKRKPKKFEELQSLGGKRSRQSLQELKEKGNLKQSCLETAPSLTCTETDFNENKEVNSQAETIPDEVQVNIEPDNPLDAQKQNIFDVSEDIQTNDNIQKDVSDITNETDVVCEVQSMKVEDKQKEIASLDANMNVHVDKNNETNVEIGNDNKVESSNSNKDEQCIDTKDENSNKKEVEQSIQAKNSKDNSNKSSCEIINEKSTDKKNEEPTEKYTSPTKDVTELATSQQTPKNKSNEEQKSTKKSSVRKSRIEKELAIDMVEGHPFLKMQSQKRLTRKALESSGTGRRKSLMEKLNKSKSGANVAKIDKTTKDKSKESGSSSSSTVVKDSQEKDSDTRDNSFTDDLPYSDDVIESSQDSSITTISVRSTKKISKKIPVVALEKIKLTMNKSEDNNQSQSILDGVIVGASGSAKANQESKDDIELPVNKTAVEEKSQADLTENMDTEPIDEKELSEVVIVLNDDVQAPLTISSDETEVGPDTQEIAEADTQPTDPRDFMEVDVPCDDTNKTTNIVEIATDDITTENKEQSPSKLKSITETPVNPSDNATITLSESQCVELETEGASSPSSFGDEAKRKQDFLNNTLEISPIKNMSPERNKKSPSPETSSDYVVIKLSSPVHSNGERFEKGGSPEVFTEEKVSPDKRDQSPPRVEFTVTNTSPSSSLSLKKNRPQVRSGGRAAQMLGLCCAPDKLQTANLENKTDTDEIKKTSTTSTPARRNLRILYNSGNENAEPTSETEESENFLKFRRSLPSVDSSPSGPILKRKLVEITDDATISPASKRKRVSFHDPPVSTTVSVQKYIEPGGVRSPQNSALKRLERQMRQNTPLKSPKRLDHAFKLDTVLNNAIESFTETGVISTPDDTQPFSLDETPVVEIVRASELNDIDPICPELVDCNDPIDNIAGELSSSAMKSLLVKELLGKVETVGDLAKMTELEVNRLCIKAPKVKVAKKVLSDYALKIVEKPIYDVMVTIDEAAFDESMHDPEPKGVDIEVQTDSNASVEVEVQTDIPSTTVTFVQTENTQTAHTIVQTDESGSKSTAEIVKSCLTERTDFVDQLSEQLEDSSIQQITQKLPSRAISDVLMRKITPADAKSLLTRVLENQWNNTPDDNHSSKELSFIREFMCERFDSKDLILFCSEVLKSVYDNDKAASP